MSKAIITVVGKDTVGIIAKVCTYLAENHVNILDISQTIVQDYFNMMMIVDVSAIEKTFGEVADELEKSGRRDRCNRKDPERRDLYKDAQNLKYIRHQVVISPYE